MADDHARVSDPVTSHRKVRRTVHDQSKKAQVLNAAATLLVFTDTQLTRQVEHATNERQQRNVIARTRLTLEGEGFIERVEETTDGVELRFRFVG